MGVLCEGLTARMEELWAEASVGEEGYELQGTTGGGGPGGGWMIMRRRRIIAAFGLGAPTAGHKSGKRKMKDHEELTGTCVLERFKG